MLLAVQPFTIAGIVVGFGLWFGLFFAVRRWGRPSDDKPSQLGSGQNRRRSASPPRKPDGLSDE